VREDRKKVGRLLKSIRREKFKTQIECAHALGLTSSAMIGAIENGSWYNQKVIFKLINYLKA
jgi:DNA-binding XRE family transcriptional regulator